MSSLPSSSEAAVRKLIAESEAVPFRTPHIRLEEAQRDRARLLFPGAKGPTGGPYKMLRTQVMRRMRELDANTLAMLSASNGEGKTLTAINLAIALAADPEYSVLLVDLDMRNPSVHRRLGFEPKVGIDDCLAHDRSIRHALVRVAGYERLCVLPCRARVEQSAELIASTRVRDLIEELRTRYSNRVVIFDLPPVLLADDALVFSRYAQAGLMVVAEGRTERDNVRRSLALLHDLTVVGTVLNGARSTVATYY